MRVVGVVGLSLLFLAGPAHADSEKSPLQGPHRESAASVHVPEACKHFVPTEKDAEVVVWNKALSFAGCVQDATVLDVRDPDELQPMVIAMTRSLAPTLALYLSIIQYGPEPVQLRAAYQIGMMYVSLVTRARSSITFAPGHAREYRALHADLEPMLAPTLHTARLVFAMIDRLATERPSIAPDPVTQHMLRSARSMLLLLDHQESDIMVGTATAAVRGRR